MTPHNAWLEPDDDEDIESSDDFDIPDKKDSQEAADIAEDKWRKSRGDK